MFNVAFFKVQCKINHAEQIRLEIEFTFLKTFIGLIRAKLTNRGMH